MKRSEHITWLAGPEGTQVARAFVQPIIPPSENVDDYFIQPPPTTTSSSSFFPLTTLTLPHSTSATTDNDNNGYGTKHIDYHLFTRSLLIHLRTLPLTWPPRRCVWHEASNTLYVLLTGK